jgi:6,7-dimethyl-8-ribityllumazine synthase
MSSIKNNIKGKKLTAPKGVKIGIVKSEYNSKITDALLESCVQELKKSGVGEKNIYVTEIPGAYEIPFACQKSALTKKCDAIIALGAVIRGETPHFDFIANSCSIGIMDVSLKMNIPIIFGVLTTNNIQQAKARIRGGNVGDKGVEAAQAAIKMLNNLSLK